jgi:hypothetical protein
MKLSQPGTAYRFLLGGWFKCRKEDNWRNSPKCFRNFRLNSVFTFTQIKYPFRLEHSFNVLGFWSDPLNLHKSEQSY